MNHNFFLCLGTLASATISHADIADAEHAMRQGNPGAALQALQDAPPCSESHYWKGRALAEMQRYDEAVIELAKVESQHALYPYAARTLMFCARRSQAPAKHLAMLTSSPDPEIALLAKALLAEHLIHAGNSVSLTDLQPEAKAKQETKGAILLLEAEQLRRSGHFDSAIAKCREAEQVALPLQREYSRLLLAEIHYDKEAANGNAEGKGEETLLKFISSYPDSVLLPEAFRRLEMHNAFSTSKYAMRKLEEWAKDGSKVYRSLLANAIIQRIAFNSRGQEDAGEIAADRALATTSDYLPITVHINNEHARYLISCGKLADAATSLARVPENKQDAYSFFFRAQTLPPTDPAATELYLKSARCAPLPLQEVALSNAMYCAHVCENTEVEESLLNADVPLASKRAVLLTHAGLNLRKKPQVSRRELEEVLNMQPTPQQKVEVDLQLSQLDIDEGQASTALARLSVYTHEERTYWPNEQVMRYYGLFLHALESEQQAGHVTQAHEAFLLEALKLTKREDVRIAITLKLAKIYTEEGKHPIALRMLEDLAAKTQDKEIKALALLLAGRASTQCMTYESVSKGAELFEAASQIESPYRLRAAILNAAVLFRINKEQEASLRINRIIAEIEQARESTQGNTHLSQEYAFALTVKADIAAIPGTEAAIQEALAINEKIIALPGLTEEWKMRSYLQQAILFTRINRSEDALYYYNLIIKSLPTIAKQCGEDHAFILTFAGTGAIACHLKMNNLAAAAELASAVYNHPIAMKYPARMEVFREWSHRIRKEHNLTDESFDLWVQMIHEASSWLSD